MINDEILHKWIDNTISERELEEFKKRPEYKDLVRIYKSTDNMSVDNLDSDKMLEDLLKVNNGAEINAMGKTKRMIWLPFLAAASIILIAGFFFLPGGEWVEYEIAKAQRMEGTLPDQSTFVLNADSKLKYDKSDWKNNRTLQLEGEGFFSVKNGSTFSVETAQGIISVLGTEFNVYSRDGTLKVACIEGKVNVKSTASDSDYVLKANEGFKLDSEGESKQPITVNSIKWKSGIVKLKHVSLAVVIGSLERQFDINIDSQDIPLDQKLTCSFQTENLSLALKTAIGHLNLTYRIIDQKNIVLEAK